MLRRFALTTTLTLVVGAGGASSALADDNTDQQIIATVFDSSGSQTTDATTVGDLETSCPQSYQGPTNLPLYEDGGTLAPETQISSQAWTIAQVLSCLSTQINPATVTGVTILGPNGPQDGPDSELTTTDLQGNSTTDGVLFGDGEGLQYERPERNTTDANADDHLELGASQAFTFDVYEGPLLTVSIGGPTTATVGSSVQFTGNVSGQGGSPVTDSWEFDGASNPSSAENPTATFSSTGFFTVTLQATDAAGGGGAATITVTVGSPTTTQTSTTPRTTGPSKSRGKTVGGHPGEHTDAGSTTTRKRNTKGHKPTTDTTPSHATPTTQTPATNPLSGAAATTTTAAPSHRDQTTSRTPHDQTPPPAGPTGPFVTGRLISDVVPLPPGRSPLVTVIPQAAATAPPLRDAVGPSALAVVGAVLGVLLLLGLGAGRELLGRRHPWA